MCFWRRVCRRSAARTAKVRRSAQKTATALVRSSLTDAVPAGLVVEQGKAVPAPKPLAAVAPAAVAAAAPEPVPVVAVAAPRSRESRSRESQRWAFLPSSSSSSSSDAGTSDDDEEEEDESSAQDDGDDGSRGAGSSSGDGEDLLGWREGGDDDNDDIRPLYNIYIDEKTMAVRFNTVHQEYRETLSERVVHNYVECTMRSGHALCTLQDVLHGVAVPEDASHLIVTFCNFAGDQFSVPFALDHPDEPFPVESTQRVTDCSLDDLPHTLVMLHKVAPDGPVVEESFGHKMLHFAWNGFRPGFAHHRPYAWTWLAELSDDPDAVLQARYDHDRYACLELATAELVVYTV